MEGVEPQPSNEPQAEFGNGEVAAAAEVASAPPPPAPASSGKQDVIDLTLSDDSDDDANNSDAESDVSEVEVHLNEETRRQLHRALETVSEARLRTVLRSLVDREQAVEIALTKELVTVQRETRGVVPRWEVCANCGEEYDVNCVEGEVCSFHPGELEVDEDGDGFLDWDERCHGPMDTDENRREYPDAFIWTCCENDGMAEGCVRGTHIPVDPSRKRRRVN